MNAKSARITNEVRDNSRTCYEYVHACPDLRYQAVINAMSEGVIIVDTNHTIVSTNPSAMRILGLTDDQTPLSSLFDPCWQAIHEDGTPYAAEALPSQLTMSNGVPLRDVIMGLRKPDGALIWLSVNTHPLVDAGQDAEHRILGVVVTLHEATLGQGTGDAIGSRFNEQSMLEQAEAAGENKYLQMINTLYEGIWVIDKEARTTFVNAPMAEMLGYTVDEMIGKPLFSFMDERGIDIATRQLERRRQGIREQHAFEFMCKDGRRIHVTLAMAPLTDALGNYSGAISGVLDMTSQVHDEQVLRDSETRFRMLAEGSTDMITVHAADGAILYISKACEALLGYTQDEMINHRASEYIHPDDLAAVVRAGEDALLHAGKWTVTYRNRCKDGAFKWFEASTNATFDPKTGVLTQTQTALRDVTTRIQDAEKLHFKSIHDGLTGLLNRARFHDELTRLNDEKRWPFSVIIADVNGLKRINDVYGHTAGDALLLHTARVLQSAFRSDDIVARIGGDEFAVLLPGADETTGKLAVERIRAEVEAHAITPALSIAIGVATCDGSMKTEDLLSLVDTRMYADKRIPRQ